MSSLIEKTFSLRKKHPRPLPRIRPEVAEQIGLLKLQRGQLMELAGHWMRLGKPDLAAETLTQAGETAHAIADLYRAYGG